MKIKKLYCTLLTTLAFSQMTAVHAGDVTRFVVAKGQDYFQTNANTVLTLTNNRPFKFTSFVDGSATDSVQAVSLKLPNAQVRTLTNNDGNFEFETGFTNKTSLDAAYAVGSYNYTIVGQHDGTNKPALALPTDAFPPVPKLANWDDVQAVEASQPLNLSWGAFTNGTTNDFIIVNVTAPDGSSVVSTPALFETNALNGTNLTAQIPANSLDYGTAYQGSLMFVKRTALSTNYPGAKGLAGYFRQTDFPLTTLPTPPSNGRIQFAASSFSALENSGAAIVTITRSGDVGAVSVDFGTTDGTAHDGQDYTGFYRTINFNDGQTSVDYEIGVNDDFLLNGNRTVNLFLTNPQDGAEIGTRSNAVLTIVDNEVAAAGKLQFATRSNSIPEAAKFITLTVNRIGGTTGTVAAEYFAYSYSFGDTAIPGLNYIATNGTVTFGPGIASKTITIPIINNSIFETNPVFHVALTNPSGGAALGTNDITRVSIINDDLGGTFAFKQSNYVTNENSTNFLVTVLRTGGAASGVTVDFNTVDGTALAGIRYVATNGTLAFGSNELSKSFQVAVINDSLPNGDQSFAVQLSNATGGANVSTNNTAKTAILTIKDDESSIAFTNATYTVGEGVGTFSITAIRSGALFVPASVNYNTLDGTANAGLDYRATNGTLVFPAGVTAKTITLSITNDTIVEDNETFQVQLSNPTNCLLGLQSITTVIITNNDFGGVINFSTNNYAVTEGGTNAIITLVRSNGLASGVTVDFLTADGSAIAGVDYSNVTQTVTFTNGETTKKIRVPILNNTVVGGNTTVLLSLNYATGGGSIGTRNLATLTISEDDLGGKFSFIKTNYSASEGATNFYVNIIRTGGKASGVSVDYFTTSGTATSDVDYGNVNNTLTFAAGETNKVIAIPIIQDTLVEGNESFTLTLANPQGGATLTTNNVATLTILDDENSVSLSNATVTVSEGIGNVVVTLVRSGVLTSPVTVNFATADGTALAGSDYRATNGTVTIPANVNSKTISIPIINDTVVENDETFTFTISNPQGGGAQLGGNATETITIQDNDTAGTIQFGAASFSGTEGGTAAIKVTRTGGLASGISASFVMSGGTATSGLDYTDMSGTITFAAGETNKTILVPIIADSIVETTETVNLSLSGPYVGSPATAILSLADKPDVNAVPITGPVFMSATLGATAVNITPNALGNAVNGVAGSSFKLQVNFFNGSLNIFDFEGVQFSTGTKQMDNSGSGGIMLYTKTGLTGGLPQSWAVANGSASVGSHGTVIIDAIDTSTKMVSGRFTFHALGDTGTTPAVLEVTNGKFRTHYN